MISSQLLASFSSVRQEVPNDIHAALSSSPAGCLVCSVCVCVCVLVAQSCLTFCHPVDCRPLGSSVHGILQARIEEWIAIPKD